MQLSNAPLQISLAFAADDTGKTNPLPIPSQQGTTPGAASYTDGFPPLCAVDPTEGGVGPSKADMNGALYALSNIDLWMSAGGKFNYNSAFQTAIGGYPIGAMLLQAAAAGAYWVSTVDNNMTDPDTGGAGWLSFTSGGSVVRMTASVYASAAQTLATGNPKVLFDTVEYDAHSLWDATDKRFVASVAGNYRVSGAVTLEGPAGQSLSTLIFKNGALLKVCFTAPQVSTGNLTMPYNAIIPCAVGDFIELFMAVPGAAVTAGTGSGSPSSYVYGQIEYLGS